MAAQIPIKNDPQANEAAIEKVRADKVREAGDGHDGTWVAHPGLVALAKEAFDARMPEPNQIDKKRDDVEVGQGDLLQVPDGPITEAGIRHNVDVGIRYMAAWLGANGCVPIYNLMEDAATAEISRSQLWQWVHHENATLDDGRPVTADLVGGVFEDVIARIRDEMGEELFASGHFTQAREIIEGIVMDPAFTEFMTTVAYDRLD
jgi:malate synthase